MGKFRIHANNGFTIMNNDAIRDPELSNRALGLLLRMQSLPENWDYSVMGLVKIQPDGRDAIASTLRELEARGYLVRTKERKPDGKFMNIYDIFDYSQKNHQEAEKPQVTAGTGNPYADATCENVETPGQIQDGVTVPGSTVTANPRGYNMVKEESNKDNKYIPPSVPPSTSLDEGRGEPESPSEPDPTTALEDHPAPPEAEPVAATASEGDGEPPLPRPDGRTEDGGNLKEQTGEGDDKPLDEWVADFDAFAPLSVNRNKLTDAFLPYCELRKKGFAAEDIVRGYRAYDAEMQRMGKEPRFYQRLEKWLRLDASGSASRYVKRPSAEAPARKLSEDEMWSSFLARSAEGFEMNCEISKLRAKVLQARMSKQAPPQEHERRIASMQAELDMLFDRFKQTHDPQGIRELVID